MLHFVDPDGSPSITIPFEPRTVNMEKCFSFPDRPSVPDIVLASLLQKDLPRVDHRRIGVSLQLTQIFAEAQVHQGLRSLFVHGR